MRSTGTPGFASVSSTDAFKLTAVNYIGTIKPMQMTGVGAVVAINSPLLLISCAKILSVIVRRPTRYPQAYNPISELAGSPRNPDDLPVSSL